MSERPSAIRQSKRCSASGIAPRGGLDAAHPAEAAHQLLERQRAPGRVEGDHLAVQDERRAGEIAPGDGHDVGQAAGDVGHAPASRWPPGRRRGGAGCARRRTCTPSRRRRRGRPAPRPRSVAISASIGSSGTKTRGAAAASAAAPPPQRERGHRGEIAGDQRGAAHRRGRRAGRLGDRLEHEPLREAHAHLAVDDALEQVALRLRGARRQLAEARLAQPPRARPGRLRDLAERRATSASVSGSPDAPGAGAGRPRTLSTRGSDAGKARPLR